MAKDCFPEFSSSLASLLDTKDRLLPKVIVASSITAIVAYGLVGKISNYKEKKELERRIKARQEHQKQNLQQTIDKVSVRGVLVTPERQEILNLNSTELLKRLKDGSLTAFNVLRAYQAKAIEATKKCNCVIEFLPEAEGWANALDRQPIKDRPLHGLPVSIKEDMAMVGYDSTVGYARFLGTKQKKDAPIVAGFKHLGAVPFCRTNVVQNLMSYSSSNPIYGRTSNPYDSDRSPGGSSGGESALIGCGGSLLGVGSDIAGSVRVPAHFSGITALKPTTGRIIATRQFGVFPGVQGMFNSPGIMAADVDTAILLAKGLYSEDVLHNYDPQSVPVPWREQMFSEPQKLRIGYYDDSNVFPITPGCKRAVHIAVNALKAAGHKLIEIPCPDSFESCHRMVQLFAADGGKTVLESWKNDAVDPSQKYQHYLFAAPEWFKLYVLRPWLSFTAKTASFIVGGISAYKLWKLMTERNEMTIEVTEQWQALKLDVVVAPAFPFPAISDKYTAELFYAFLYTMVYNHMNFPAGVVPVTRESAKDQADLEFYDTKGDKLLELTKKAARGSEGLPIGVQVVSYPWREEMVLRTMKEIQDTIPVPYTR